MSLPVTERSDISYPQLLSLRPRRRMREGGSGGESWVFLRFRWNLKTGKRWIFGEVPTNRPTVTRHFFRSPVSLRLMMLLPLKSSHAPLDTDVSPFPLSLSGPSSSSSFSSPPTSSWQPVPDPSNDIVGGSTSEESSFPRSNIILLHFLFCALDLD